MSRRKQNRYRRTKREIQHTAVENASHFVSLVQARSKGTIKSVDTESEAEPAPAPKFRGKKKKGIDELCKWTALSREQETMLQLFVRKGDVRELLVRAWRKTVSTHF